MRRSQRYERARARWRRGPKPHRRRRRRRRGLTKSADLTSTAAARTSKKNGVVRLLGGFLEQSAPLRGTNKPRLFLPSWRRGSKRARPRSASASVEERCSTPTTSCSKREKEHSSPRPSFSIYLSADARRRGRRGEGGTAHPATGKRDAKRVPGEGSAGGLGCAEEDEKSLSLLFFFFFFGRQKSEVGRPAPTFARLGGKNEAKEKRKKKKTFSMSSVRRTSPRRGGAVSNDLRARPGQADSSVSFRWFLGRCVFSGGERGEKRERREERDKRREREAKRRRRHR